MKEILHLTLKKNWFDLIAKGIKKFEYREIKPYWNKRFFDCLLNCTKSKHYGDCQEVIGNNVVNSFPCYNCEHSSKKHFDEVHFKNGYSKTAPFMRIDIINISRSNLKNDLDIIQSVYVIALGEILEIRNWHESS